MIYHCERRLQISAAADTVWHWMADARRLLRLNIFHTAVLYSEPVLQAGLRIPIAHNICGLYHRTRIARIRIYHKYVVAWGELQAEGKDWFPHSQSFTVLPIDAQSCFIVNQLRGKFFMPGARYWFLPFYRLIAPRILDHENHQIASAVAAMCAETTAKPTTSS